MKTKDRITEQLSYETYRVSYDVTHMAQKKWLTKSCKLCWQVIGPTLTLGVNLKTNRNFNIGVIIASLLLGNK